MVVVGGEAGRRGESQRGGGEEEERGRGEEREVGIWYGILTVATPGQVPRPLLTPRELFPALGDVKIVN